jgi:phosphoribosylanthranilate isomerase
MIVQIYTMQTPEEALEIIGMGVDHIGVTPSNCGLPGEVSIETAKTIFAAVGSRAKRVALSVDEDIDAIVMMALAVRPDVLHLCGNILAVPPEAVRIIRQRLPSVQIMQAIPVQGPEAVEQMLSFQDAADIILLDSKSEDVTGIGATGLTHDWNISRKIVARSQKPVILAGGLSPENVAEAIRQVRPWGVDSLTHTNQPLGGGRFRKDLERVREFVKAARAA